MVFYPMTKLIRQFFSWKSWPNWNRNGYEPQYQFSRQMFLFSYIAFFLPRLNKIAINEKWFSSNLFWQKLFMLFGFKLKDVIISRRIQLLLVSRIRLPSAPMTKFRLGKLEINKYRMQKNLLSLLFANVFTNVRNSWSRRPPNIKLRFFGRITIQTSFFKKYFWIYSDERKLM